MRDRLNIGLIGCGMMGRTHACAVESQKWCYTPSDPAAGAKITAVCTRHEETAKAAAEGYSLGTATTDEDELIYSPDIDIVDISTPNIYHYETAKKALSDLVKTRQIGLQAKDTIPVAWDEIIDDVLERYQMLIDRYGRSE